MKTTEEKTKDVFTECHRRCNMNQKEITDGIVLEKRGVEEFIILKVTGGQGWGLCGISKFSSIGDINVAYFLLGLEARDAVESYKQSLQSDLNSMTAIVSSVKNGTQPDYVHVSVLQAERAKSAALVEALDEIKTINHRTYQSEVETMREIASKALEANKKGATT